LHDYITDKEQMDFIFKRESLAKDWKEFCLKYKIEYSPLSNINKTKSIKDWKELYRINPEATQLVYNLYQKDFEHFGYKIVNP